MDKNEQLREIKWELSALKKENDRLITRQRSIWIGMVIGLVIYFTTKIFT